MKIAAKVQYFGMNYKGFQRQAKGNTVQGELEKSLSTIAGEEVKIHGAGRTDSLVSAVGQVISFDFPKPIKDFKDFLFHWNMVLPIDIAVDDMVEAPASFDARHSCMGKRYRYCFSLGKKMPLQYGTVAYLGVRSFDFDAFKQALNLFLGEHNFHNFTTKKMDKDGYIRNIVSIEAKYENGIYSVDFESNGFMTYQIRFMVGSALKVAFGKMGLEKIQEALDNPNRAILPFKAPGEGLCLMEVLYAEHLFA